MSELPVIHVRKVECAKCGYKWFPDIDKKQGKVKVPLRCANRACNNPNWNRPEKIRGKK